MEKKEYRIYCLTEARDAMIPVMQCLLDSGRTVDFYDLRYSLSRINTLLEIDGVSVSDDLMGDGSE